MPDVTVLMPVYNGEQHVGAAVDSILAQTHRDFELLIVDDGSTDRSREIIASRRDTRVRLVSKQRNAGLSAALNEGLALVHTPLVARQDADDLSEPNRLERQLAVMASNPDVALLGSQAVAITEHGAPTGVVERPLTGSSIRWFSIFDNPFIHTSVMFRADAVSALGGFSAAYDPFSQDYDLWCRVMDRHAVANLPEPLVRYRVSDASIIGALDTGAAAGDYQQRFESIVRELTTRQARRVLGADAVNDADTALMGGLAVGLDRRWTSAFLSLFERLLARYRAGRADTATRDFRRTLSRQFEAAAYRTRPATRSSTLAIYSHALRHHPSVATSISWPRVMAALLLGGTGRRRLAQWKRRHALLAKS